MCTLIVPLLAGCGAGKQHSTDQDSTDRADLAEQEPQETTDLADDENDAEEYVCPEVTDVCHQFGSQCGEGFDSTIFTCKPLLDDHGCVVGDSFDGPASRDCADEERYCVERPTDTGNPVHEAVCVKPLGDFSGRPYCGGIAGFDCEEPDVFCYFSPGAYCGSGDMTGTCLPDPYPCTDSEPRPLCAYAGELTGGHYLMVDFFNECQLVHTRICGISEGHCRQLTSCAVDEDCAVEQNYVHLACVEGICVLASCTSESCPNYRPCPTADGYECRTIAPDQECHSVCVPAELSSLHR